MEIEELYRPHFDGEFYLSSYPDVSEAGVDPLSHFVGWGEFEGRRPARWFMVESQPLELRRPGFEARPFGQFVRSGFLMPPHPLIDPVKWRTAVKRGRLPSFAQNKLCLSDDFVFNLARDWWSPEEYLRANPDLRPGIDLVEHFCNFGIFEERRIAPSVRVALLENLALDADFERVIDRLNFGGREFVVVQHLSPPQGVIDQVLELEQIDPMILSPGYEAVSTLRIFSGANLKVRDSVDVGGLEALVGTGVRALVVVGSMEIGGGRNS